MLSLFNIEIIAVHIRVNLHLFLIYKQALITAALIVQRLAGQ